ncbi:Nitrate reductase [Polystyrenella longa]|uniref:Nitrate reductase n=1 Tax=Polystyrenella longa TaxID=2528007 RepID=A0A518CSY9_9PLAN|nr:nitrate reductase [Polystyrenella longa]QDU82342.1 Nitrate reductase [Polystyrenella longa]
MTLPPESTPTMEPETTSVDPSLLKKVTDTAWSFIRQKEGKLTRELLLEPGGFGLGKVPARLAPDATTTAVCGYCSTGCGLKIHLKNGEAVNLTPNTEYPVNLGMACPKGWEALNVLNAPDRGTTPLLKNAKSGRLEPVDWDIALASFTDRFKAIQEKHGPASVAFLSTGQLPTEEMTYLGSLAKFGMGMLHGDGNTRQCMATAVVAYKQAFGFDAPPYTYQDFEESDTIVLVGSNLCIAHPIMWERVMRNPHSPEIIVLDPRMTETAMQSTMHFPINPKSDQTLLYTIANILVQNNWIDWEFVNEHTNGIHEFIEFIEPFTLERAETETGIPQRDIKQLALKIHEGKRVSFWWTMGVNQSYQGVRTAQAIINLALMTGNIGRPGTGANSITGQCNAMGSRLYSNTTSLLGGHDFTVPEHREKVAGILGIDSQLIPDQNSKAYNEIMEGILRGEIKGLWVICTNTAHSWINQSQTKDILSRLDFLVVQDMYHSTETAQMADLFLPAAGWGEKEGTFINSERRYGLLKKVKTAPGNALSDFNIFRLISKYWGCDQLFEKWQSPEDVFQTMKQLSIGQPCDITGIKDYKMLDRLNGVQWPAATDAAELGSQRRLFEDGRFYHEDGRARFLFEEPKPLSEPTSSAYPFILNTGRGTASQWHTQTRTSKSEVLKKLYPESIYAELNPQDARELGVVSNDWIVVKSQRGRLRAKAFVTQAVRPRQIFIPMHYKETNVLTDAVFDPYSKQPSYKTCAVKVHLEGKLS